MQSTPTRRFVAAILAGVIASTPLLATAQDVGPEAEKVEATEAQQSYNDRGVIMTQDGKYREAIAAFRSSLSLGELNVTYLNLGRAYFRLERCLEAREAYDAVKKAPKVEVPTPEEVEQILSRFEKDYSEKCSATVAITCDGEPMVSVDDQPARACSDVSGWPVTPGTHEVVATYGDAAVTEEVTVDPRAVASVSFAEPEPEPEPVEEPIAAQPAPEPVDASTPAYVWLTLGTGVALIGSAVVWDLAVTGPKVDELDDKFDSTNAGDIDEADELRDEIETDQMITLILGGAGLAVTVTGALLWLFTGGDETAESGVSAWVGEDGAGVVFGGSF